MVGPVSAKRRNAIRVLKPRHDGIADSKKMLAIEYANDSFDFNQEAMTQFNVSVSQKMFPAGDTLRLAGDKFTLAQGDQYRWCEDNSFGDVAMEVSKLWLNGIHSYEREHQLVKQKIETLFEQLHEVGKVVIARRTASQQQDLVRSEIGVNKLDHRLTQLRQAERKIPAKNCLNIFFR